MARMDEAMNHTSAVRIVQDPGDFADKRRYVQQAAGGSSNTVLEIVSYYELPCDVELAFRLPHLVERRDAGVIQEGVDLRGQHEMSGGDPLPQQLQGDRSPSQRRERVS